ncbi:ABC transporter substrate-binding protein [Paenibacillus xylaniclasticus]|uniref:ABC transporter substrate-binding protein n=1 Tax=Paenibacillus xylaniclasticus TaxID=588083 RepID=UPI0013E0127A|nr:MULTISPECIES: extracellular solute-binding protein [Paenibacillus]GFN34079.1 sugar ABC transporter substrate-binding protein [Paenibacillus curdlanolyticus]
MSDVTVLRFLTEFQNLHNVNDAIASFERLHPNVRIIVEQVADHFESLQAFDADDAPDMIESGGWSLFNRPGMFVDLMPYVHEAPGLQEDLNPGIMRVACKDGSLPGLPVDVAVPLIMYDKEKFDRANLAYPTEDWTWDDMMTLGEKLTIRNEQGIAQQLGFGIGVDIEFFEPFIMRNGGRCIALDGMARGSIDQPAAIEAFQKIIDAYRVHRMILKPDEPSEAGNLHEGFAMVFAFTWFTGDCIHYGFDNRFGVVGLPNMPGGQQDNMIYMGAAGITSKSHHPQLAWEFLNHYILQRPDPFRSAFTLPITRSLAEQSGMTEHPIWSRYIKELDHVQISGFYLNEKWNSSRQLINEDINRMILEGADVAQTLKSWTRFA